MTEERPAAGSGVPTGRFANPHLRPVTAEDVHHLSAVLAEAFFDDPVFGWLMPKDGKRLAQLRRYFGLDLGHYALPHGRVWTTNDLTGAALTLPPGKWRVPPRTTLLHGSAFGIHLPRAARMGATMEWRHAREIRGPHYYVRDIGVHPDMQGNGLGSALLTPTLERCDREGVSAYLEASSERNAALYARHGFRLVKELRVGGSPPLRLMIRPSQPPRAGS